jgi:hypothetical protein
MESSESEPELVFKLSDQNEFYCSACGCAVASIGNGRFVVSGLPDLIVLFKQHVERYQPKQSQERQEFGFIHSTTSVRPKARDRSASARQSVAPKEKLSHSFRSKYQ